MQHYILQHKLFNCGSTNNACHSSWQHQYPRDLLVSFPCGSLRFPCLYHCPLSLLTGSESNSTSSSLAAFSTIVSYLLHRHAIRSAYNFQDIVFLLFFFITNKTTKYYIPSDLLTGKAWTIPL